MQQAASNSGGHAPCVVIKKNHEQPLCVLKLDDFMYIVSLATAHRQSTGKESAAPASLPAPFPGQKIAADLRRLAAVLDGFGMEESLPNDGEIESRPQ